jgi:hypothetical protein
MSTEPGALTDAQRTDLLNHEVARYALAGWTVSSVVGNQAVLQRTVRIRFWVNLVLMLLTWGLWLIVVALRILNRRIESLVITVDHSGKVSREFSPTEALLTITLWAPSGSNRRPKD